jgi:hypothetical protein
MEIDRAHADCIRRSFQEYARKPWVLADDGRTVRANRTRARGEQNGMKQLATLHRTWPSHLGHDPPKPDGCGGLKNSGKVP